MFTFREFSALAKKGIEDEELVVARGELGHMYDHLTGDVYEPNRRSQSLVTKMACLLQEADVEAQREGAYERMALVAAHEVAWKAYEELNRARIERAHAEVSDARRMLLRAYGKLLALPENQWEGLDPEHDHVNQLLVGIELRLRHLLDTGEWLQPDTIVTPENEEEPMEELDLDAVADEILQVADSILNERRAPSSDSLDLDIIARKLKKHANQPERGSGS